MDRNLRSLTALDGAASSRVLNLAAIAVAQAENESHRAKPLFMSPVLNRSIILKHRLRPSEAEAFSPRRAVATKVIIPFEKSDLRVGGRSFFVGERNYGALLGEVGNYNDGTGINRDMEVLQAIDAIPSLDPFMLREHLREHEIFADGCYFAMSPSDQRAMFQFAAREVRQLTSLALGGGRSETASSSKMVAALLSGEAVERLEPLRLTFNLDQADFAKGIFSWRGFLYYKWNLQSAWPGLIEVLREIRSIRPVNRMNADESAFIEQTKRCLASAAKNSADNVHHVLGTYDTAYGHLIKEHEPKRFRDFLLDSPSLFREMGERLGAMAHIVSFWRYRFPLETPKKIEVEELLTIFQDFAHSLGLESENASWRPT